MRLGEKIVEGIKNITYLFLYLMIYIAIRFICIHVFSVFYFYGYSGDLNSPAVYQSLNDEIKIYIFKNTNVIIMITCIVSLLIYLVILKLKKSSLPAVCSFSKFKPRLVIACLTISLSLNILAVIAVRWIYANRSLEDYSKSLDSVYNNSSVFIAILCTVIIAPIFEEILFRGIIFYELKKTFQIIIAVILQASIFALWHFNFIQAIYAFFLAILFALSYLWSQSIWIPIIMHVFYNGTALIIRKTGLIDLVIGYEVYFILLSLLSITLVIRYMQLASKRTLLQDKIISNSP